MLFGHNYFNVNIKDNKVKIDTDKSEFNITVKNDKVTINVNTEDNIDDCSEYDNCNSYENEEQKVPEVIVDEIVDENKTLDNVC